jgi:hypothetical protein
MAIERYKVEQVIKALEQTHGAVSLAAERLGCSQQTVRNYRDRHPSVAKVIDDQRDRMVDIAELKLLEAVQVRGEAWAIALVLKTLGKNRGYVEKTQQEISIPDGIAVTAKQDFNVDRYIEQRRSLPGGTSGPRLLGANGSDESVDTPHPNGKTG